MRFALILSLHWLVLVSPGRPDTVCDAIARKIFERTNQERQKASVAPLTWNAILGQAAANHSQDMCKYDFFSHESPVERRLTPADRVREVGGPGNTCGENIYWSNGYPVEKIPGLALDQWLVDPEHRENLVNPEFHLLGVGVYRQKKAFWVTQVFTD
ncbi:CAP domain-containing protein [bacterium]|nr:CAP domain-containing protein [bacterium]